MKRTVRVFIIGIFILSYLLLLTTVSMANPAPIDSDGYIPNQGTQSEFLDLTGNALGVVQIVGSFVSVIALVIIGIKYMIGSIEERAEYKKTMIPYAIGAVMVFASSNVAKILYDLAQNFPA